MGNRCSSRTGNGVAGDNDSGNGSNSESYSSCCGGRGKKTTKTADVQQNKRSSISAQEQNQIKHDGTGGGAVQGSVAVVVIGANGNNQQQQLDIYSREESSMASVEGLEPGGGGSHDTAATSSSDHMVHPPLIQPPVVQLQHQLSKTSAGSGSLTAAPSPTTPAAAMAATTDPVAEALRQLPDQVRQVLHGCVTVSSSHGAVVERGSNIIVYVTSADPSASSSRAASQLLETAIDASQIHQLANSRGASLQILCHPWAQSSTASSSSSSGLGDRIGRISLSNLSRLMETSHVIPVLVFGDSLGRPCLPLSIEAQDFQSVLHQASTIDDERRLLLETWYRSDQQSQPLCYRLHSASAMTEEVQQRLIEILVNVLSPELSDAYLTTLFEQEVHNSVCMSQELARRCVWIRESNNTHPIGGATGNNCSCASPSTLGPSLSSSSSSSEAAATTMTASIVERENRRRVTAVQKTLKGLLQEKNVICRQVQQQQQQSVAVSSLAATLRSIVDELLDECEAKETLSRSSPLPRSFLDDINQHLAFCQRAASCSVNRESALLAIKRYMTSSTDRHPLIIYGAEGSGKTCLVARAAQQCHNWQPPDPTTAEMGLILRFARLTPQSCTALTLLASLTRQVSLILTGRIPHIPHTLVDYERTLHALLGGDGGSVRRRVTFIMDGIDHLDDYSDCCDLLVSWLPSQLPLNIKVILTLRNSDQLDLLRSRLPESAFHQLEELSAVEAHNLFDACLIQNAHRSHGDHLVTIAAQINQSHRPLTVKILSWQAGLGEEFRENDGDLLPCSTNILPNLSRAIEELTGQNQAAGLMIALFTSSRYGLCDYEMEQIFRLYLPGSTNGWASWASMAHLLAPFLQRVVVGGMGLLSWRDATLRQQMTETFLADPHETADIHRKMLDYFWHKVWRQSRAVLESRNWIDLATPSAASVSQLRLVRRALDEIPHHLSRLDVLETQDKWQELWSDAGWLLAKLATSGVAQVVEDLNMTPDSCRPESLKQWLVLGAVALDYDYRQLAGQLVGRGANKSEEIDVFIRNPLVPGFLPSLVCLQVASSANSSSTGAQDVCISAIYRLNGGERHHAAALSAVRDEMSLWDFTAGQCDKVLGNLQHQPLKVAPLANDRCVVLCGRELRVYDINTGGELLKLKGMMNQKLPLFGLHGDSHVVSLSRNRMYVNLISLENGDCVTTFKVGEDRFLNSLLVSDNGRLLVCGDESKRPCSLLVWDLQAKKLIYDLKMNHHEFITRLSAITGDGTYVACVCKELETSDPNFIVVYDLQSGTLFKKWKAGANTVAVSIACQNTCVVTSLQDARILVWDLGTGNCRWSLIGHAAAVDTLNLDAEGWNLLSWDSQDNDRSLRLWNLANGQDVASFTADQRTTAAQLSADGQVVLIALAGRSDLIQLKLVPTPNQSST